MSVSFSAPNMFYPSSGGSEPLGGSKSDILRGIIAETLSAAAREILAAVERTVAGYEEESSGLRRQLELLQPQVRLRRAGVEGTEPLSPAWENREGMDESQEEPAPKSHPEVKGHLDPSRSVSPDRPQISDGQNPLKLQIHSQDDSTIQCVEVKMEETDEFLIDLPDTEADLMVKSETGLYQRSVSPDRPQISDRRNPLKVQTHSQDDSGVQGVEVKKEEAEEFLIDLPDAEVDPMTDSETRLYQRPEDSSDDSTSDPHDQLSEEALEEDQTFSVEQKSGGEGQIAEDGAVSCKVCGLSFTLLGHLIQHTWDHVDGPENTCGVCGETCESVKELKEHVRTHQKVHSCPHCGQTFPSMHRLDSHVCKHTGQNLFSCDVCNESFSLQTDLSQHKLTHSKEQRHTCEVCGKCFKQEDALKMHKETHKVGDGSYRCHVCFISFHFKSQLTFHLKTHSQQKSFVCSFCSKAFGSNRDLERHTRVHTNETPFKCAKCGRCFKQNTHLASHAKIHSGVKDFVCGVCGKAFSWRHLLIVHMRTHNGERPYKCTLCEKAFMQSYGLKRHMMSHQRKGTLSRSGPEQEPSTASEEQTQQIDSQ